MFAEDSGFPFDFGDVRALVRLRKPKHYDTLANLLQCWCVKFQQGELLASRTLSLFFKYFFHES